MKLRLVIGLILILAFAIQVSAQIKLPFVVAQQKAYYDEIAQIAKGGYAGCKIYHHEIADGKIIPKKFLERVIKYYPDGRINEIEFLTLDGDVESIDIYYYYPNKLPKSITTFSTNGAEIHKEVYRYSDEGNLIELAEYDRHGYILSKIVVEIDIDKQMACAARYISPDEFEWRTCYYFNDLQSGGLDAREDFNGQNELVNRRIITYENNKIVSEKVYLPDSTIAYQLNYENNTDGDNSVVYVVKPAKKPVEIIRYNYNPLHLMIGMLESDFNGQIKKMIKKQYY